MNDTEFHTPRLLLVLLHGGAGIKGRPDMPNMLPLSGWDVNADIISVDYPTGYTWPGTLWWFAHRLWELKVKYRPSSIACMGMSHGGWLLHRSAYHFTRQPYSTAAVPDKIVTFYAPTRLTDLSDFMTSPENVNEMYNEFLTGDRMHTANSNIQRGAANLRSLDIPTLAYHGDADPVVNFKQLAHIQGGNVERHVLPGEVHGFNPLQLPAVKRRVTEFITHPGRYPRS